MNYLGIYAVRFIVKLKLKHLMETKMSKEIKVEEVPLLEQKGYEKIVNEIMPVQQTETYSNPTQEVVEEAVKELNPDKNSMNSRG